MFADVPQPSRIAANHQRKLEIAQRGLTNHAQPTPPRILWASLPGLQLTTLSNYA
jgi:hypothetical protein